MDGRILGAMLKKHARAKCDLSRAPTPPKRSNVVQTSSPPLALPPSSQVHMSADEIPSEKSPDNSMISELS